MEEPYWLGLHPILEQRISGLRLIWPDDHSTDLSGRDVSGTVSDRIGSADRIPGDTAVGGNPDARRYAHLAVIDGGKQ